MYNINTVGMFIEDSKVKTYLVNKFLFWFFLKSHLILITTQAFKIQDILAKTLMCCNLILLDVFFVHSGEQYLPAKRMFLLGLCLMKKTKGWSALKTSVIDAERSVMTAAVAAAASVPSSFTSTTAWWTTFDRTRSLPGDMPVGRRVFHAQSLILLRLFFLDDV